MNDKKLPDHVEIDLSYYPENIGPGGFSPSLMKAHALALNKNPIVFEMQPLKSWIILWMLDHIDWDKVPEKDKIFYDKPT